MYHERLTLRNFTAFTDETLEFVPGINVLIGENGTGKTHVLKALYAWQMARHLADKGRGADYADVFEKTYGVKSAEELLRAKSKTALVAGKYGESEWEVDFQRANAADNGVRPKPERPVFIPAIDMMAHTKNMNGIMRDYADFDRTCFDLLAMVTSQQLRNGKSEDRYLHTGAIGALANLIPGTVEWDDEEQRFYLQDKSRRLPFPLIAEGIRKVSALYRLIQLGWIRPGGVLFWDEPEVNINPKWMDEIIEALVTIAQSGVQIFLATHDYVILKQINLVLRQQKYRQGEHTSVCFFSLQKERGGSKAVAADDFAKLQPNPILEQYEQMLTEDWRLQDREDNIK